jgi:hypothetical protein
MITSTPAQTLPKLGCFFSGPSYAHAEHVWSSRSGHVYCYGMTEEEAHAMRAAKARDALKSAWLRAGENPRSVSTTVQLAVVAYCTAVPGTPVPTLDDVSAVRALVLRIG